MSIKFLFLVICAFHSSNRIKIFGMNIELESITNFKPVVNYDNLHCYIKKNFPEIINEFIDCPNSTIKKIKKKHGKLVGTAFSNVLVMTLNQTKYNLEFLRSYFFIQEIRELDLSLKFTLLQNKVDKKKYITHHNEAGHKNLELISIFINYMSYFQDISVKELATLFGCIEYLRYYLFMFGNNFNEYMQNRPCIII